jgi:DNA-binding beta-propeller fold protein YncE
MALKLLAKSYLSPTLMLLLILNCTVVVAPKLHSASRGRVRKSHVGPTQYDVWPVRRSAATFSFSEQEISQRGIKPGRSIGAYHCRDGFSAGTKWDKLYDMQKEEYVLTKMRLPIGLALAMISWLWFLGTTSGFATEVEIQDGPGNPSGFLHVMTFGSKGEGKGQFNYIEDFDLTSDGKHLLATDAENATVQVFDKKTGECVATFGGKGDKPESLVKPEGISVAPDGRIFVADYTSGFVKIYDPNYRHLKTFSRSGSGPGENIKSEFTCIHDGKYYMAEAGNHRVNVWDLDGKFLFAFGQLGEANGQLNPPQACKVNNKGEFIVCDLGNNRIQVFDKEGKFLRAWGTVGSGGGSFRRPAGIGIDKHDNVYVAEIGNCRVQVFDRMGKLIAKFGTKGSGNGEFENLHGCFVDRETGWLYVADTANNRVQVFKPTEKMAEKLAGSQ